MIIFFGCKQELSEGGVTEDVAVKVANDKHLWLKEVMNIY